MIPIHVDLSEIVAEFALTGSQAQELGGEIINRVVTEYVNKWENLVNRELKKTRKLYKNAMYVDRVSPTEVVFGLAPGQDGLALALEEAAREGLVFASKEYCASIGTGLRRRLGFIDNKQKWSAM